MNNLASTANSAATCGCISFIFLLVATCSAWTIWGAVEISPYAYNFGLSPFVAGTNWGPSSYWSSNFVYWADLNVKNVCESPNSEVLTLYGKPYGMCAEDPAAPGSYTFALPSAVMAIQATVILATILSFFTCVAGYSINSSKDVGAWVAAGTSLLAMIFTICAFSLWCTWDLSSQCVYGDGCYVPVWQTQGVLSLVSVKGSPIKIKMYFGGSWIVTVLSFMFLLISTGGFFTVAASYKRRDEDAGTFGAGI